MKMSIADYNTIEATFKANKEKIINYYNYMKEDGNYKVLEVRVAWDCLRAFLGTSWICKQYDKGLNDDHINTACVKALKKII